MRTEPARSGIHKSLVVPLPDYSSEVQGIAIRRVKADTDLLIFLGGLR